jgi:hypothetical protein
MKRVLFSLTMSGLLVGLLWAQNPAGTSADAADRVAPGSLIPAELTKSVDAKKAKPGDLVQAKTSVELRGQDGSVAVPAGARIVGHVTEVTAREKGESSSTLGIVFDKMVFKDGREVPMSATIQALAPPLLNSSNMTNDSMSQPGGARGVSPSQPSGGMYGGMSRPAGTSPAENPGGGGMGTGGSGNPVSGASSGGVGRLSTNAQGVVGIPGLSLQGDVLTSQKKNVKLDSGTQLMLQVGGQH